MLQAKESNTSKSAKQTQPEAYGACAVARATGATQKAHVNRTATMVKPV
jgi:hypothetical protein